MTHRGRRLCVVVLAVAALVGFAAPARAHAILESSEPAAGASFTTPPKQVLLRFGESVEVALGAVRVFDSKGQRVDDGSSHHADGDSRTVAVALKSSLANGGYVVTWRVISADAHPVHGAFTFRIGTGGGAGDDLSAQVAALQSADKGDRTVGVLAGIGRAVGFGALSVLVGAAAMIAVLWAEGRSTRRARRLLWGAWLGSVLATVVVLLLQGPYGGALPLSKAVDLDVLRNVLHTRLGTVYLVRLGLLVLAAPLLVRLVGRPGGTPPGGSVPVSWRAPAGAVGLAILLTPGLAGHAAVGDLVPLALAFDLVHLGAVAVWLGGLAVLGAALLPGASLDTGSSDTSAPSASDAMDRVVPRFSQVAFVAVVAVLVSGLFAAWRQVGSLSLVTTTTFGRLLLAKSVLFVALVALAALSRRIVHGDLHLPFGFGTRVPVRPRPAPVRRAAGPGAALADPAVARSRRLRRAVTAELGIAAALLAVTSMLVNTPPARAVAAKPFSADAKAGPLTVQVTVDPARAGVLAIHLYTESANGQNQDVPEVTATLTLLSAGGADSGELDPITVPLQKLAVGHFAAYGLDVPIKGRWALDARVRTDDFTSIPAERVTIPIS